jgi:hypothetical protein|tara:strand:+ start:373 stop:765 length:393 start_codon:yes stop_codon:yes gene_type:complete
MAIKKYPDSIVFDYELDVFDSNKKQYPTDLGAPAFQPLLIDKSDSKKANKYFSSQLSELKDKYNQLKEEYEWTAQVYESEYSFQPILGEVYHLYSKSNGCEFLSLISPSEWDQQHIGSFKLLNNGNWKKL